MGEAGVLGRGFSAQSLRYAPRNPTLTRAGRRITVVGLAWTPLGAGSLASRWLSAGRWEHSEGGG